MNVAQCPVCNSYMLTSVLYCPKCGEPRTELRERFRQVAIAQGSSYDDVVAQQRGPYPPELGVERRNAILQAWIAMYAAQGFRVTNQTMTTAQMVKPKEFNFIVAALGLLFLVVGLFLYLIYFASQKEPTVYFNVDERGNVSMNRT